MRLESPSNSGFKWPFEPPVISAITHGNDDTQIVWKIEEIVSDATEYLVEGSDYGRFIIRHTDCDQTDGNDLKNGLCSNCEKKKRTLFRRFDSNINIRNDDFNEKSRSSLDRTFSLKDRRVDYYVNKSRRSSQKLSYRQRALDKLAEETGVDVLVNESSDLIFDTKLEDNVAMFLSSDDGDRTNAVFEYVFREACAKYKQAKQHGRSSIRHSPLVIRLGAAVLKKMGYSGGLYDLVAKCMGLPHSRTIAKYTTQSSSMHDGILFDNLDTARQAFDQSYPNCPTQDFKRHLVMSFDEMHTKGRFAVNYHTGELIGIANDAFELSVIEREFKELKLDAGDDEDNEEEIAVPQATKKFLVFLATTVSNEGKPEIRNQQYSTLFCRCRL
jgi:hypothetical protein